MADNLTTMQPLQKERYLGTVNESLNSVEELVGWLEKRPCSGGPNPAAGSSTAPPVSVHFVSHVSRNAAGTFTNPDGNFPTAGSQGFVRGSYLPKVMFWPVQVTRSAIRNMRSDDDSYARAMVVSAVDAGKDVTNHLDRVFCGDGSGTLGVAGSVPACSGNQLVVTLTNAADCRKFYVGQNLNVWSARTAGGTQRTCVTGGGDTALTNIVNVVSVSPTAGTITLQGIASITVGVGGGYTTGGTWTTTNIVANDVFTVANDQIASPYTGARTSTIPYEPMGIDGLVSDRDPPMQNGPGSGGTNYGGLYNILAPANFAGTANTNGSPTTYSTWTSSVNRNTVGRAYSDAILQGLLDSIRINGGTGNKPNLFATSYGGRFEFGSPKFGIRRTVNRMAISGDTGAGFAESEQGSDFLEYGGVPIVPLRFAPVSKDSNSATTCSFIALKTEGDEGAAIYEWHKVRFVDDDGLTWRMQGRQASFEGILEYAAELVAFRRNCHAKATDVFATEPV